MSDELRAAREAEEKLLAEIEMAKAEEAEAAESLQRLREANAAAEALEAWERKLLGLVLECLRDADKGLDVLVSDGWDMVLEHWRARPQR